MIRKLIVYINSDRSVFPKELKIANQFEIKTNEIKFIFDGDIPRTGYPYLILTNRNGSFYLPLVDDSVVFGSQETWIMGGWSAHIMISEAEIINGIVNKSEKLFISDDFGLWVEPSDINIDDLKEQQIPTPLKLLYDDLFALKARVEEILDGGLSDGKDGMSAYELALQEGFVGTLDDWLTSLKGKEGPPGPAYTLTVSDKAVITASVKSEIDPELKDLKESYAKKTELPTKTSQLTNDSGFLTEHQDLSEYQKTVNADNKYQPKGNYEPSGKAESKVNEHNVASDSHNDIRLLIQGLTDRLNAFLDTDDTTLDQMSELVAYINSNKSLIDSITTSKVNVSDIVDNLTTSVSNKPLSAKQAVVLKGLIDALQSSLNSHTADTTKHISASERQSWDAKSNFSGSYKDLTNVPTEFKPADHDHTNYELEIDKLKESIVDLSVFVTPQMYGAKGDGSTDDTQAFKDAIANANGKLIIPSGNYLITSTLTISSQIIIEGEGSEKSKVTYTGTGYLFNISTNAKNRATIKHLQFYGSTNNSFIYCGNGGWGACFTLEECFVVRFDSTIFNFVSSFGVNVRNSRIVSRGKIVAVPYSTSVAVANTLTNVHSFENVYFGGNVVEGETQVDITLFNLSNTQYFTFYGCAFEKVKTIFNLSNYSQQIVMYGCNIEQTTNLYTKDSTSSEPRFINTNTFTSKFDANCGSLDYIITSPEQNLSMYVRSGTDTMGAIFDNTPISLYKKVVTNNNSGATQQYANIYDFTTRGLNTLVPINLNRTIFASDDNIRFDLKQCTNNIDVSAIYDVDAFIEYKDGSHRWVTVSVYGKSFSNLTISNTIIKKVSAELTNADNDRSVFTMDGTSLAYESDFATQQITLNVRSNVTGKTY